MKFRGTPSGPFMRISEERTDTNLEKKSDTPCLFSERVEEELFPTAELSEEKHDYTCRRRKDAETRSSPQTGW